MWCPGAIHIVALSTLIVLDLPLCAFCGECQIYYLRQPPSELPCNPYLSAGSTQQPELVLGCEVRGPYIQPNIIDYTIEWKRQTDLARAEVEDLSGDLLTDSFEIERTPLFNDAQLMKSGKYSKLRIRLDKLTSPNAVLTGSYWCQVTLFRNATTSQESSGIPLQPSSKMTLHDERVYRTVLPSNIPCLNTTPFSQPLLTCVDNLESSYTESSPAGRTNASPSLSPSTDSEHGTTELSNGVLVVLAASGAIMLTIIIILSLSLVYSCLHIKNTTQLRDYRGQRNSVHSDFNASVVTTTTYANQDLVDCEPTVMQFQPHHASTADLVCDDGTTSTDSGGDRDRRQRVVAYRRELSAEALEYVPGGHCMPLCIS